MESDKSNETIPLLDAQKITKAFGDLVANDSVDLLIMPGEIHALLGENGAGKSTLVKILYGVLRPDSGDLFWNGSLLNISGPAEARQTGIGMVFQHFSLFESLTVAENIALAMPPDTNLDKISGEVVEVSNSYGLPLEPDRLVHTLSVGERQRIEIVRCLLQKPKLLVMDEPTSVLTPQEADKMFETLKLLSSQGCAILYISHRLEEVKAICQSATILRRGKVVGHCTPAEQSAKELARMMVGEEIGEVKSHDISPGNIRLKVENLSKRADDIFGTDLQNISFNIRGGEILGIAGVAGNGQDELFQTLSGEAQVDAKTVIEIDGTNIASMNINQRRKLKAAFVPEERIGHSAIQLLPLSHNNLLSTHVNEKIVSRSGLISWRNSRDLADRTVDRFDVRIPRPDPDAGNLSGGNLQKFVVGREIMQDPGVLLVNQPTWGVDAGAAATIRQELVDLAAAGSAILVISQDLDEVFELCSKIAVISEGSLSEAKSSKDMSLDEIGLLMGGADHGDAPSNAEVSGATSNAH